MKLVFSAEFIQEMVDTEQIEQKWNIVLQENKVDEMKCVLIRILNIFLNNDIRTGNIKWWTGKLFISVVFQWSENVASNYRHKLFVYNINNLPELLTKQGNIWREACCSWEIKTASEKNSQEYSN